MQDHDAEREANIFAVCLLIPKDLLLVEINKMGGLDLSSDEPLKKLANIFQVPLTAMSFRIGLLKLK